jgi:hypothetical protein
VFSKQELRVIEKYKDNAFDSIASENYDGSIHIDVFDLYRSDKQEVSLVVEDGDIRLEGTLVECLDYIHRWL